MEKISYDFDLDDFGSSSKSCRLVDKSILDLLVKRFYEGGDEDEEFLYLIKEIKK